MRQRGMRFVGIGALRSCYHSFELAFGDCTMILGSIQLSLAQRRQFLAFTLGLLNDEPVGTAT